MGGAHEHALPSVRPGGFLEQRDARAKVVATLALVLGVVLAPREEPRRLVVLAGLALALAGLGATPPARVLLRATVVLPFAVLGTFFLPFIEPNGLARMADIVARASISGVAVAALGSSTELPDLVTALGAIGVPRVVVLTMGFTLRYLVLLREEGKRLALARELRTFAWRPRLALRAMGHSVGTLFVRTFERAERVHAAMAARGFEGTFPVLDKGRAGAVDVVFALGSVVGALVIDLYDR